MTTHAMQITTKAGTRYDFNNVPADHVAAIKASFKAVAAPTGPAVFHTDSGSEIWIREGQIESVLFMKAGAKMMGDGAHEYVVQGTE